MQSQSIEGFQLSPQQKRVWLLQSSESSLAYRAQCTVLIEGNLELKYLKLAIRDVVARHESLRTHFTCFPGMTLPLQVVTDQVNLSGDHHHLGGLTPQEQAAKIEALWQELSQLPFDFEHGSSLHFSLATLSAKQHLLFFCLPALCADRVGLENLVGEISQSYLAYLGGESFNGEVWQYADFSDWQNEILTAEGGQAEQAYWREQYSSGICAIRLPYEKPTFEKPRFAPRSFTIKMPSATEGHLEAFACKYKTSISIVLLACWQVLLWRLTGQSDMIVGAAYDGRKYQEVKKVIGLFSKFLPLRYHLQKDLQLSELLQQIHESVNNAYLWQEYFDWDQIAEPADSPIDLSFLPFCFEFAEQPAPYFAGEVSFAISNRYACFDRFKIKLSCTQQDDAIVATFHYDANLFYEDDIERLAEQWKTLLKSVDEDYELRICDLQILGNAERQKLLVEFNSNKVIDPIDTFIHRLFEEQVIRTPEKIAAISGEQKITYFQLNARANQLAHYLQKLGVGAGSLVALCVERSLEMLIGILGILKAGGAYLPLDPTYPAERLAFMLEDAQSPILLTQQQLVEKLPKPKQHIIYLDTDWKTIGESSPENLDIQLTTDSLAYIIYTSGSTGLPKGVMVTHENLVHSTTARLTYYKEPVSSFLLLSSFAFDSSIAGIFWTLCQGGSLVLPPQNVQEDLPHLTALIVQNHVSHLLSIPSLYTLILKQSQVEQLACLRAVVVAGEVCSKHLLELHNKQLPQIPLFNEYGPTEATVWSSVYECQLHARTPLVPIGRPIANTQIYILDSSLQMVPIGVPGEICIGGNGVARGYLNRPDLTTEKFIPNPFSTEPASRLYRTGDLARFLPDGNIEFVGRIDHQIKILGFRIEPGEIEDLLAQHPVVEKAVVVARGDEPSARRLVAYIVLEQQQTVENDNLRDFLRAKLPEYMVPSAFIVLTSFPLGPNGKVDRQALALLEQYNPTAKQAFVAPRTPLEELLSQIWMEVLGIEQVGVDHNFFELGGNSIQAALVINRLQEKLKKMLYVTAIFEAPTIASLSTYLEIHYSDSTLDFREKAENHAVSISKTKQITAIDPSKILEMRRLMSPDKPKQCKISSSKNPSAIFILSPPRSGSTLLRVMLAGHPSLFVPPELELLSYETLEERNIDLSGRNKVFGEGYPRAIMELYGYSAEQAFALMETYVNQGLTIQQCYWELQQQIGLRKLVDKTTTYAFSIETMRKAEEYFVDPLYIHLTRHPCGTINSFVDAKFETVMKYNPPYNAPFPAQEQAEMVWLISHQNILKFLEKIPGHRQHRVRYEDLVHQPKPTIEKLCQFLSLDLKFDMLNPYKGKRMTDGIYPESRMLGDPKFHQHKNIDAETAEKWRAFYSADELAAITQQLADNLGY